ncbi:uncharacterized protein [Palaemon carinicauda]|uniref:uncharacterized protein n=1 Tax=Palaemon carinicauda TaxID=392227 RepID=UPI0035B5C6D8
MWYSIVCLLHVNKDKLLQVFRNFKDDYRRIDSELTGLKKENTNLKEAVLQHERYLEVMEPEKRSRNIIFVGVPEGDLIITNTEGEAIIISKDNEKINQILKKLQRDDTHIEDVLRLGKPTTNRNRVMIAKLQSKADRDRILEAAPTLKTTASGFDRIFIKIDVYPLEIKTSYPFPLAGFSCIRSKIIEGEELCGGVAVLIKSYLFENYVYDVNEVKDQVWFRLRHLPDLFIFKGGDPRDPGNYRGINIMAALPKLYDHILNNRLEQWFITDEEQAGAKKGRGCEEQILTSHVLIDITRKTKAPLYIIFVDFAKAYDKINRKTLIGLLQRMGCGSNIVRAIRNSLETTSSMIGNSTIEAEAGVRQGSPTMCFLFTAYANPMIRMVKEYGQDGWLGFLHLILLMDDTVLVSTTELGIRWKFQNVLKYCKEYNMKVNNKKTKLMCINVKDLNPLVFNEITVEVCDKYTYLGNQIMNAPMDKQVEEHIKTHSKSLRKFQSFLSKNNDAPFSVKRKVWPAGLNSSIFYDSETWMSYNLKAASNAYLSSLRDLLSVRKTVCSDLVFLESGEPSATAFIKKNSLTF